MRRERCIHGPCLCVGRTIRRRTLALALVVFVKPAAVVVEARLPAATAVCQEVSIDEYASDCIYMQLAFASDIRASVVVLAPPAEL